MASVTAPGLLISSMRMLCLVPIPLPTMTLPLPDSIWKKLRASAMEMILPTGISVALSQRNR